MFTRLLQTVLSFKINLSTNFQIGGQLEDKLSNWRTWRTNCQIGGRPPEWRTVVLYGTPDNDYRKSVAAGIILSLVWLLGG